MYEFIIWMMSDLNPLQVSRPNPQDSFLHWSYTTVNQMEHYDKFYLVLDDILRLTPKCKCGRVECTGDIRFYPNQTEMDMVNQVNEDRILNDRYHEFRKRKARVLNDR